MELINMPSLNARTPEEAIGQIQSYLWQFAEQVQMAMEESKRIERELVEKAGQPVSIPKETPKATFTKVKDLIIKSAEIVEAYRTEITKSLEGQYVAASTFGTYREQTAARFTETDKNITQNYQMIAEIVTNVEGLEGGLREMNAYIRTGLLFQGEDGVARYGVEIGETASKDGVQSFRKFARLVSDRLSFFDQNDIEVAYISDRKLYITSAQVEDITAKVARINMIILGDYVLEAKADGHLTLS